MCVCGGCVNICMYFCVVCGYVYIYICVSILIQNGGCESTSTRTCISNHTSSFGNCSLFGKGLARGQVPLFVKYIVSVESG